MRPSPTEIGFFDDKHGIESRPDRPLPRLIASQKPLDGRAFWCGAPVLAAGKAQSGDIPVGSIVRQPPLIFGSAADTFCSDEFFKDATDAGLDFYDDLIEIEECQTPAAWGSPADVHKRLSFQEEPHYLLDFRESYLTPPPERAAEKVLEALPDEATLPGDTDPNLLMQFVFTYDLHENDNRDIPSIMTWRVGEFLVVSTEVKEAICALDPVRHDFFQIKIGKTDRHGHVSDVSDRYYVFRLHGRLDPIMLSASPGYSIQVSYQGDTEKDIVIDADIVAHRHIWASRKLGFGSLRTGDLIVSPELLQKLTENDPKNIGFVKKSKLARFKPTLNVSG